MVPSSYVRHLKHIDLVQVLNVQFELSGIPLLYF